MKIEKQRKYGRNKDIEFLFENYFLIFRKSVQQLNGQWDFFFFF